MLRHRYFRLVFLSVIFVNAAFAFDPSRCLASAPITKATVRIMAIGDSITRGSGYGNYRYPLQLILRREGYRCMFVGTSTEQSWSYHGPDPLQQTASLEPNHEGYGSIRIDQSCSDSPWTDDGGVVYPGLKSALEQDRPDVALLMLGTNDIRQGYDPEGNGFGTDAAARMVQLVDRLHTLSPSIKIVVALVTPLADPVLESRASQFNTALRTFIDRRTTDGKVWLADMFSTLTQSELSADGVHPNTAGYDKMASIWFTALTGKKALISALPPIPSGGAGSLDQHNVFCSRDTVVVSSSFSSPAFRSAALVDGTSRAFVFGKSDEERVSISGFDCGITRFRFFDTPSYTGRTAGKVSVYYSDRRLMSLKLSDYAFAGTFILSTVGPYPAPAVGDVYLYATYPAQHPASGEPQVHRLAIIDYCQIDHVKIPPHTKAVLLDFSKTTGDPDGLTEIQAFDDMRR